MNTEQITQIVETIKTLNLNIDSESAVQITETLRPILWFYLLKGAIISISSFIAFVVAIYFISRTIGSFYKNRD